jgi:hypothetical protein
MAASMAVQSVEWTENMTDGLKADLTVWISAVP